MNEEEPGGFLPPQIPGLAFWVRADKGITLGTGLGVSAWADQSGAGDANRNMVQATGSAQPAFTATDSAYNNHPTLTFVAAASQNLSSGTWSSAATAFSFFLVGNTGVPESGIIVDNYNNAEFQLIHVNDAGDLYFYGGSFLTTNTGGTATTVPCVIGVTANSSTASIYLSAETAKNTGSAGTPMILGLQLGQAEGVFLDGKVAEIIVYGRILTSTEINQVLAYTGSRYGITIGP